MKTSVYLLPLLALLPAVCLAQPKPGAPEAALQVSIDPAAKALFDIATAQYSLASGVRFEVATTENKVLTRSRVAFHKPNLLRVENSNTSNNRLSFTLISDGKSVYTVHGKAFEQHAIPRESRQFWQDALPTGTGYLMSVMLQGKSVLDDIQKSAPPHAQAKMIVTAAPATVMNGESLRGVRINFSADKPVKNASVVYIWFGSDGLLRRFSSNDTFGANRHQLTEVLSHQQLNPTFAPNTFQFNATGLTPAAEQTTEKEPAYFDPRLKVGARPFAFSAKTLNGQTVSPANFKGKVLLLDFWATWCGPCVASLPDLQAAYNKHHAQGLEVVGISLDEDKSALTSFIKTNKMPWPQVFDGQGWKSKVPNIYGVKAIPFFLVIGRDGKIAAVNPRGDLEGAVKRALAAS